MAALVRSTGPVRRGLAAIAGRLIATRGWERLGFARLADYARERAGLSARQVQDLAHVDGALGRLPRIEAALIDGVLSWTQVRLLCRVAAPDDESRWIDFAKRLTARALAREVRALDLGSIEAGALDADEHTDENGSSRTESVAIRCTPEVHAKFHRARWLARRVAGENLPTWGCMEAVAGEVLSALPGTGEPEEEAFRDLAGAPVEANGCVDERPAETQRSKGPAAAGPGEMANGCTTYARRAELPLFVRSLLTGMAEADAFELDARLRRAVALEQRIEAEAAPLLREVADGHLHRRLGFNTLEGWARERLGISPRKLRALLRLARTGSRCPALARAFASGRLSWVQAHALVPVLLIAPTDAEREAWVERASAISVRRLYEEVDATLQSVQSVEADRQTGARDTPAERSAEAARFFFVGPRDVVRLFRAVVCSMRRALERRAGRSVSEGEAAEAMFDHALAVWEATACGGRGHLRREHRVFERDGWRCTVPGCSSFRNLHDHHVAFRSAGGSDELANRTTLCAWHHLRGVHAGRVRCSGRAPDGLRFELGLRSGLRPLLAYEPGERLSALSLGAPG